MDFVHTQLNEKIIKSRTAYVSNAVVCQELHDKYYQKIVNLYLQVRTEGYPKNEYQERFGLFFYEFASAFRWCGNIEHLYQAREVMRFGLFVIDQSSENLGLYQGLIEELGHLIKQEANRGSTAIQNTSEELLVLKKELHKAKLHVAKLEDKINRLQQ